MRQAVKIIELFAGPLDGQQLKIEADADCFIYSVHAIQGRSVLIADYIYRETERANKRGKAIIFEYRGNGNGQV